MWKYLLDEPPLVESEEDITRYGRSRLRLSPLVTGAHSLANWDQRSDNNNYDSKYSVVERVGAFWVFIFKIPSTCRATIGATN